MLKNKKSLIFVLLSILLFLSACSTAKVNGDEKENVSGEKTGFKRPDFGQPNEDPAFMGLVKSVTGNEVTILKIERQERSGQDTKTSAEGVEEGTKAPAIGTTGGRFPGAGGAGATGARGGFNQGQGDGDQQAQMLEAMKKMSSGEEKIIIPVGSQMLKRDETSTESLGMVEASLIDITKDKMIQVWLDKSSTDRNIASFVMIMQ